MILHTEHTIQTNAEVLALSLKTSFLFRCHQFYNNGNWYNFFSDLSLAFITVSGLYMSTKVPTLYDAHDPNGAIYTL